MNNPYKAFGWALIPLKKKTPLIKDHLNTAAVDDSTLTAWETQFANVNWGVACKKSNLVIVDIDPRNGGSLAQVEDQFGKLPATVTATTLSGGLHIFFKRPSRPVLRTRKLLGVDLLADGNYAVINPSVGYTWTHAPHNTPLAPLPFSITDYLTAKTRRKAGSEYHDDLWVPCGNRFYTLQSIAGRLRNLGLGQEALEAALKAVYEHHIEKDGQEYDEKIEQLAEWASTLPSELNIVAEVEYEGKNYEVAGKEIKKALDAGAIFIRRI